MICDALGDAVAGLVDGELDHPGRERAQAHLLHCDDCRSDVDAQRRLKSRLVGLAARGGPEPSADLTARLLAMPVPGTEPTRQPVVVGPVRPAAVRGPARPGGPLAPATRRSGRSLRRRTTVGSALAVIGVGALIALGGPRAAGGVLPVDPGGNGFVVDYINRTVEVPMTTEPVGADLVP